MLPNFSNGPEALLSALGIVSVIIIIFLLLREIATWYWKLNRIVELLEMIEENTRPKEFNEIKTPNEIEKQ